MNKNYSNNEIEHIKHGDVEHLEFKILQKYSDKLAHGFYLRRGGVSQGYYESLNFRTRGKDKIENVFKNLDLVCKDLDIQAKDVCKALQAHTDKTLVIDETNKSNYIFEKLNEEEYDAYLTNQKNIASVITTADCNPIIIYDPVKNVVANVHSGWIGTTKRIYLRTIEKMQETFGSDPKDLIVCVGPAIQKCCWTSADEKLKQEFLKKWPYEKEYIETDENGRYYVDFPYVIKKDLIECGVKEQNIVLSNICTCSNNEDFFSYRQSTMKKESDYGTEATIVELI